MTNNNNGKQPAGYSKESYIKKHKELINRMQQTDQRHRQTLKDLYGIDLY